MAQDKATAEGQFTSFPQLGTEEFYMHQSFVSSLLAPLANPEPRQRNWSVFNMSSPMQQLTPPSAVDMQHEMNQLDESVQNLDSLIRAAELAKYAPQSSTDAKKRLAAKPPTAPSTSTITVAPGSRKGKWSYEEQKYAVAILQYFKKGLLDIPAGTTLRSYMSEKLQCDPMRVSKKLAGTHFAGYPIEKKMGKRTFVPCDQGLDQDAFQKMIEPIKNKMTILEQEFLKRLKEDERLAVSETQLSKRKKKEEKAKKIGRCGPWILEEERYTVALVHYFLDGVLTLAHGVTLRSFLAQQLKCDPMRISKKLSGGKLADVVIPKRVGTKSFVPKMGPGIKKQMEKAAAEIYRLRREFLYATGMAEMIPLTGAPVSPPLENQLEQIESRKRTISEGNISPPGVLRDENNNNIELDWKIEAVDFKKRRVDMFM